MSLLRSFSTLGCPGFTLDEMLAVAVRFELGAIEIRAIGGTIDVPAYLAKAFGTPAELARKMAGSKIRIVSLDTSLHMIGATAEERAALLQFVPWAEALGVRWLRVFDGGKSGDAAELAAGAETMRWWQELRRANGWRVDWMIETHDALFSAAAINRFLALSPDSWILWDSHHTWRKGGEDPVVTWAGIQHKVVHVHVKDSVGIPSQRHPFSYRLPGAGEFPMKPLLAALRESRFAGAISLEWELLWHPELAPLEDALQAAKDGTWW